MIQPNQIPNGLAQIIHMFGDCNASDFEAKNIVSFDLPYPLFYNGKLVLRSRCHRLAVENFLKAFNLLLDSGLSDQVRSYGGIYQYRAKRGGTEPSVHSWGIAVDLEPVKFPLRSLKRFSPEVVNALKLAGFSYGGDFKNRRDPQHFQMAIGY